MLQVSLHYLKAETNYENVKKTLNVKIVLKI